MTAKLERTLLKDCITKQGSNTNIGVAPIMQLRTCMITIVTLREGTQSGKSDFPYQRNCS